MSSSQYSSRDFSFFSLFTAGLACLVPFTTAYTKPTGDAPEGNAIYQPGLNSIVPAGENFTVTWDPTTKGTVTLVLLKGPSTNAVAQYAIAERIDNSGSYVWSPKTDLAPADTGYGLELIVDATGQYQYSTQFGISNDAYVAPSSTSAAASTSSAATHPTGPPPWASGWGTQTTWASTWSVPGAPSGYTWTTSTASAKVTGGVNGTAITTTTVASNATTISPVMVTGVPSSGYLPGNSSIIQPTGSLTVPYSLKTSATLTASSTSVASATGASPTPTAANGASGVATSFVGLVVAAGVAVFVL